MSGNPLKLSKKTDWGLCCFCQSEKSEKLKHPYEKVCYHQAYETIEKDFTNFLSNNLMLPYGMTKECLIGEGEECISKSLLNNKAVYHKTCRDNIRSHIVERKLEKRRKDEAEASHSNYSPKKTRRSFDAKCDRKQPQCIYCHLHQEDNSEPISTSVSDGEKLKKMAMEAQNWIVYARISAAFDATVGGFYYHKSCYRKLANEARAAKSKKSKETKTTPLPYDPLVMAELIAFIQCNGSVMKLADLRNLYSQRLQQVRSDWLTVNIHPTRFKEHLLLKLGDEWQVYTKGRDVLLSTKSKAGSLMLESLTQELSEEEAKKIVEVGLLLRKHILSSQAPFMGSFSSKCLSESVPNSLLTLLQVLLEGTSSIQNMEDHETASARIRVACTLSQLLISNAAKQATNAHNLYQMHDKETPVPLYIGLKLHSHDRLKNVIREFHQLGVTLSYDRIMEIRRKFAQAVSKRFKDEGVVVPTNCKRNVFSTATTDNIDVSGRTEMHGTSITLIGHVSKGNMGIDPPTLTLDVPEDTLIELPDEFAVVPFIEDLGGDISFSFIPKGSGRPAKIEHVDVDEEAWLAHVCSISRKDKVEDKWQLEEVPVTFAGFFSKSQERDDVKPRAVIGVFPVFSEDKADTLSMQKHAMLVTKKAIAFVNPGQIPVLEGDCPLYALQKRCQLLFPEELGEQQMVCMFGFLHLEMCTQEAGGKLMGGSGWERMFHLAKIFTPGVAASLLGGKHVKRTRQAYLLTLAWLEILRRNAYEKYCQQPGSHDSFEVWQEHLLSTSPTAYYWGKIVRDFLLTSCRFVRSQRTGNWPGTLDAIDDLCPYFFALGHTNYSRWVPVFLRDMEQLPHRHPAVHANFMEGHFVVQRSEKKFSLMGLDQSQEHSIKLLKEDSGPKGLYSQAKEKIIIELSRPEVLRVIEEFEYASIHTTQSDNNEHPESSTSEQQRFLNQLKSMLELVDQGIIINPYEETGNQLVTLDTGEYMDPEVNRSLQELPAIGKAMYLKFTKERLEDCTTPLSDVIPKANLYTFLHRPPVNLGKGADKLASCKSSAAIITQMFVSLQARPDSNMDEFFMHENSRHPPSLSNKGKLRVGTKSQILACLPGMPARGRNSRVKQASVVILDMPAVVHIIKPQRAHVFGDYARQHLLPFMENQMSSCTTRIDAVWDRYPQHSLKNQTRVRRLGETVARRTRVSERVPIPKGKHWQAFLKVSENKDELFKFLSDELMNATSTAKYHLLTTKEEVVLSNKATDLSDITPSDHEEADSRMILHLRHAVMDGHKKVFLRTVDSDVVVLSVHHFATLQNLGLTELWIGFGSGKAYTDIPIHEISLQLGNDKCIALPFFHAFTGCDVTSSMLGIGKKSGWNAWMNFPKVTETMINLIENPHELAEDSLHMQHIEELTVMMYTKNCSSVTVNEARRLMFTHGLRSLENIPPTKAALYQHVKRTIFVSAFIWHRALDKRFCLPDPAEYGWEWNERLKTWVPHWTDLGDSSTACALMLHCTCAKACKGNCKCFKAGLRCTPLCKCEGGCCNNLE